MKKVDINVDIGEGFPFDEDLLDFATSANVCCGAHAGSWELTKDTLFLCERKGVRVGMHPGFPDRETMGRARLQADEVTQYAHSILEQAVRFKEYFGNVAYVKPHGAWANMLTDREPPNPALFTACKMMLEGVLACAKCPVLVLKGSPVIQTLKVAGESVIEEGYADRAYEEDGALVSRTKPGAVLVDPDAVRAQVLWLGSRVDSICIHGDTPDCLKFAEVVYAALEDNGFEVGY